MALSGSFNTNSYKGRYYTFNWYADQSISGNSSLIHWNIVAAGDTSWIAERTVRVVVDGQTVFAKDNRVERVPGKISEGTLTLHHNQQGGRSFSASIEAAVYTASISCRGSGSFALDTIARYATIINGQDFNDLQNPTITYSNPAGNSIAGVRGFIYFDGIEIVRDLSRTANSGVFNLTEEERNKLRLHCANSKSMTVMFRIGSWFSGEADYTWSSQYRTFTVANAEPTLNPTLTITDALTKSLTGKTDTVIKGVSSVKFTDGAAVYKYTTPKDRYASNGSQRINGGSGTFDKVESNSFYFLISDNRGYTTTKTITKPIINYVPLTCNLTNAKAELTSGTDAKIHLEVEGNFFNGSFGAVENTVSLKYRYKVNSGNYGGWVSFLAVPEGNAYRGSADITGLTYTDVFTVQVAAADKVSSEVLSAEETVKALPVFDWGENDFNFNVSVTVKGKELDYLLGSGFSNGWYWEKWNSGKAICYQNFNYTVNLQDGNKDSWVELNSAFPFTFKELPIMEVTISNVTNWTHHFIRALHTTSKVTELGFATQNSSGGTVEATGVAGIIVIGRWK